MSDWQVGDLALCVRATGEPWKYLPGTPAMRAGSIYSVDGVVDICGQCGLIFQEHPSSHPQRAFCASAFRKITPPAADEFDREVIEQMNGAPVGEPVARWRA